MEVSRLKICLEEATDPARNPLPGNVYPILTSPESQSSSTQIAELKDALAEKSDFLKMEEQRSARLSDLLNQSIMEVNRLKICLEETTGTAGPPLPETSKQNQDTPPTSSEEKGQHHEKPHQGSNTLHGDPKQDSTQTHNEERSVNNTNGSEYFTEDENGSALSTATTQVQNEVPVILPISEGTLFKRRKSRGEPTTTTEDDNHGHFVIHTHQGSFTLSSLDEDDPHMKEEHKDLRPAPAPDC
ncbi:hypothetical protein B9Z19DRAFT_1077886, partial [Tuber borchii]